MADTPLDTKKLVITSPGRQYNSPESDAMIVFMEKHDFLDRSVDTIAGYVEQFGTLKTLTIVGHGNSNIIASVERGPDPTAVFNIPDFLQKLEEVQKQTGIKIADRIVFDACATMTDLKPDDVKKLRGAAKSLGSEIVGATTNITYNAHPNDKAPIVDKDESGLFVAFHPDGTVSRDSLSTTASDVLKRNEVILDKVIKEDSNFFTWLTGIDKSVTQTLKTQYAVDPSQNGEKELTALYSEEKTRAKWFAGHDGKSQDEGAACQTGDALPKVRADSRDTGALKTPVEPNNPPPYKTEKPAVIGTIQSAPSL